MNFFPPAIDPLSRLRVSQGLLITAERWQHAQDYQRQRQNLHYQSLHQPGVVRGFGVTAIPVPDQALEQERHHLWVRIFPGIAIDVKGNPIILNSPVEFGIDSTKLDLKHGNLQTIYLVVQYVDPEHRSGIEFFEAQQAANLDPLPDKVQEGCRLVQRSRFELQPEDVELCRVQLQLDSPQLQNAENVHSPGTNTLDLRHRLTAQVRPRVVVKVAQCFTDSPEGTINRSLRTLVEGGNGLFPTLYGDSRISTIALDQLNLPSPAKQSSNDLVGTLDECQLAYIPPSLLSSLAGAGRERLRQYLHWGGVLLIAMDNARLQSLETIHREITSVLTDLHKNPAEVDDPEYLKSQLEPRLHQVQYHINDLVSTLCQQVRTCAQQLNYPLYGDGAVGANHLLKSQPFTFADWPSVQGIPLRLFCWKGIVLAIGPIFELWQVDGDKVRSRQEIRTAQEFGVNLLHYAWSHHHLTQLQQGATQP